jgi:hypothetical protein
MSLWNIQSLKTLFHMNEIELPGIREDHEEHPTRYPIALPRLTSHNACSLSQNSYILLPIWTSKLIVVRLVAASCPPHCLRVVVFMVGSSHFNPYFLTGSLISANYIRLWRLTGTQGIEGVSRENPIHEQEPICGVSF